MTKAVNPVVSTAALRKRYNALLVSPWKRSTLEQVLTLLWEEITTSERPLKVSFQEALYPDRNRLGKNGYNREALDAIADFRRHFDGNGIIPKMPTELPNGKASKLLARAETTWTYLILPSLAKLSGESGFFADTLSLLFLVTIDFLLPELRQHGHEREHACVINALYMHTHITWTLDPERQAHHFFLQAVLMDYLGRRRLRQENLLQSLQLTPLEDHSFLTKVQAYVFSLLDAGEARSARNFLLDLYRRAPQEYLAEIGEMLEQAQGHIAVSRS
jgi:hypothetical protein